MYAESLVKPDFEVSENTIKIVLPVFETNADLTEDEKVIYKILSKIMLKPISEIAPYVPFGKSKTIQLLKTMGKRKALTNKRLFTIIKSKQSFIFWRKCTWVIGKRKY